MINFMMAAGWTMLYLAIGVFLDTLISDKELSFIMVLIWPLPLILAVIMYVCVYIPTRLAEWVNKKWG